MLSGPALEARRVCGRASGRVFFGLGALLFVASAALTIVWCAAMSSLGGMSMPGNWKLSMAWMRMPGQTWAGATAGFLAMWVMMMAAMMLPCALPMLWRYRQALPTADSRQLAQLTALAGVGYFLVWSGFGVIVFPVGAGLTALAMRLPALARAVPLAVGVVVVAAGALQFTAWKARHLACCQRASARGHCLAADAAAAWRYGLRLGLHCGCCCAGLTAILLVIGLMDLRAMAVVTTAITLERLAPQGERIARAIGLAALGAGLFLSTRALGLG